MPTYLPYLVTYHTGQTGAISVVSPGQERESNLDDGSNDRKNIPT